MVLCRQTQQLQMQPMSRPDVNPGTTETQQMRITAPAGVSLSLSYPNFAFPPSLPPSIPYYPNESVRADFTPFFFLFWARRVTSGYVYEYRTRLVGGPFKTK